MLEWLESVILFFKKFWGIIIIFVICFSICGLFIASFCLDKVITLSVMNEWVSLIVGMVALLLGIISLFLSFYNVEQSNATQKDTINILNTLIGNVDSKLQSVREEVNTIPEKTVTKMYRVEKNETGTVKTEFNTWEGLEIER